MRVSTKGRWPETLMNSNFLSGSRTFCLATLYNPRCTFFFLALSASNFTADQENNEVVNHINRNSPTIKRTMICGTPSDGVFSLFFFLPSIAIKYLRCIMLPSPFSRCLGCQTGSGTNITDYFCFVLSHIFEAIVQILFKREQETAMLRSWGSNKSASGFWPNPRKEPSFLHSRRRNPRGEQKLGKIWDGIV